MEENICSWSPVLIVDLIKGTIWPLTILLISLGFRAGIISTLKSFFTKNSVSEFSATATGVSAKFVAAKQSSEALESGSTGAVSLPENMTIDAIKERHSQVETEFSGELLDSIKVHVRALNLPLEDVSDILMKEVAVLQSAVRYYDINKVLFRSQYNLFSIMSKNNDYVSKEELKNHFETIKEVTGDTFSEWDWIRYIAYPSSTGLLTDEGDGYKLSKLGRSYVQFMNKSPQLVDELSKI